MAKKNFEKGLEKLFSNVQSSEPTEEKEATPVKDDSAAEEQNNTEGIAIKDLMNLAFDKIINEYEKKYGVVRLPKVKKGGDVSKVFDLS